MQRRNFIKGMAALGVTSVAGGALGQLRHDADPSTAYAIGCYTRPWDQHEYRVALDGIAEAGYRYAGLMTAKGASWVMVTPRTPAEAVTEMAAAARQRGLRLLSVYGEFSVSTSVEQGIRELRRLIDHCVACGSPNLLLGGTGEAKLFEPYYHVIAECCAEATTKGVGLSIKPHGGLNATGPQCRQIIERVGHPNFRLWYDPGNIYYYSEGERDPVVDASTVDGLVAGMSVKDYRHPKEVMVTPGTGKVNFQEVLARLRRGGFARGPLLVECLERGDVAEITAQARKARLFLEALTQRITASNAGQAR
jgi:sugar phosphate isomerase/epimerase